MKKFNLALRLCRNLKTCLIFTSLAVAMLSLPLYAEHDGQEGEKKMCCKMKGMQGMMMGKSVTATSDGGIVIVAGNKITKYDKNLKLVKEVEAQMDMEGMKEMGGKCPMMKGDKKMDEKKDEPATSAPAISAEDHAAHH